MTAYKFEGWLANDPSAVDGNMVWGKYEPKTWTENDVDIKISHCSICGSDLHTLRSGWTPTDYPCCVGHEIIGHIVRLGTSISHLTLGQRVGVGAQSGSCGLPHCAECSCSNENLCQNRWISTYGGRYTDGSKSYGGYSRYCRVPGRFVVPIPEALESVHAAPMLCAGITTYRALVDNGAGKKRKRVGVVGIGGLGHFALLWAKALGCESVVAVSRTREKEALARKLGADSLIATNEEGWNTHVTNAKSLDLIVCTSNSADMPLGGYLDLLGVRGEFIQIGEPEGTLPRINVFALIGRDVKVGGSVIGSPKMIREMLDFAVEKGVRPWVEVRKMGDANEAIRDQGKGKARMRFVLVNEN